MATVLSTFDASHEECRHRVCIVLKDEEPYLKLKYSNTRFFN